MKPNQILLGIGLVCVLVAGIMYVWAYARAPYVHMIDQAVSSSTSTAAGKTAIASIPDGTYTVYIHSIMSSSEDTSITFTHVTYFEGEQASTSASHEVKCPNQPLQACVPTLTRGFYVRASSAPDFTAPVPKGATIVLHDASDGSVKSLRTMVREFQPVFDVVIKNGNVFSITEKSPT